MAIRYIARLSPKLLPSALTVFMLQCKIPGAHRVLVGPGSTKSDTSDTFTG
jgi:hypothetical protein